MTGSRRSLRRRAAWLAPAATAAVVAGAVAVPMAATAGTPDLPATTPQALIASIGSADAAALSGRVEETARLGLPSLPGDVGGGSTSWQSLLTGTHRIDVAVDGPQRQRLALVGTLAETDVVHDGTDLWTYASGTGAVTHVQLPTGALAPHAEPNLPAPMALTPQEAAQRVLAAVSPTTEVTVGPDATVAGRDAYTLVLAPKQASSTIGRVVVAIDGHRHLPLRVQVFAAGDRAEPAFETGFTSISFDRPAASTFAFVPPAGSTVTTHRLAAPAPGSAHRSAGTDSATGGTSGAATKPKALGTGWTSVVELSPGPDALASLFGGSAGTSGNRSAGALLDRLFVTQQDGGRLLHTALVNVLITADGRVLAGAVQPDVLQHDAATR